MYNDKLLPLLRYFLLAVALGALAGCFGEGDGKERIPGTPPTVLSGIFVDSAVEGVTFATPSQSGITDAAGTFVYVDNEPVTFSIGGIVLGTTTGAPVVSAVELTNSLSPTSDAALNLLVFLQSIDADGNPSNGITVTAAARTAAANRTLDFFAADFDTAVIDIVAALVGPGTPIVSDDDALFHFYQTYAELGGTDTFEFLFPGFPPVGGGGGFELVFSEEFNEGTAPDPDVWNYELGYGQNGWGNNEWQLYTDSPVNVRVENGNLVIQARCDTPPCGVRDGTVTSARITTLDKFEFRYGKVFARIKPPVGKAAWPAFWALGANFPEIGWPLSGEIDFMEMHNFFSDERTAHFTVHWCDQSIQAPLPCSFPEGWVFDTQNTSESPATTFTESLGDDFHIFEAEWDENRIIGKIDGVQFFERAIDPATMEEFRRDFFMILNVAMGGTLGSNGQPPAGDEVFPQTMLVDYVRVFQRVGDPPPDDDPGTGLEQIDLPITFNDPDVDYSVIDFGDPVPVATTLVVDPTDADNIAASTTKPPGAPLWAGTTISTEAGLASPIPFSSTQTTIGVRVYSPDAGIPVRLKAENAADGSISVETEATTTVANDWETLVFDFADEVEFAPLDLDATYQKLSIFFNFGTDGDTAGEKTYLWDDVIFGILPPVIDETAPTLTTVSIASSNANAALAVVGDTVTVTLVADESITQPVVSIAGVAAGTVTGAGQSWQASRTLTTTDAEGAIGITIEYSDLAGNAGTPVSATTDASSVILDATSPTVAIQGAPASFTTLDPIALSFQFSEPVTGFGSPDIQVTNGAKTGFMAVDPTLYTVTVTPNGIGDLAIAVGPGAAADLAGNPSVGAMPVTVTNDFDADTPLLSTVTIASNNANGAFAVTGDVVTISMTATEDIVEPTVTIAGQPAESVTGAGVSWQAARTMLATDAEGIVAFTINFEDLGGNAGPQTTVTTDDSSVTFDLTAPTVSIDGLPATILTTDPIAVTFAFDEAVTGFDAGDVSVTNGTAGNFAAVDEATYTADITVDGAGNVTVAVAADAATDLAGNPNVAASVTRTVDLSPFWQLVWSDEFTGVTVNPANWNVRTDADCPDPCAGVQSYLASRVGVANGMLNIEARNDGGLSFSSGLLDTLGKRELRYGRIEIDALLPGTVGLLPSLWLLPADGSYGPWPQSGEIDIVSAPELGVAANADLGQALHYGLPLPENTVTAATYTSPTPPEVSTLTYALEWEGGEIRWFVDDVHVLTQTADNWYTYYPDAEGIFTLGEGDAPFDQNFYLVLGLKVLENAGVGSAFPQTLQVDAVRVYRCANAVDPDAGTGCSTGDPGVTPVEAPGAPSATTLEVYTDAPAVLSFDVGGTVYMNNLEAGFTDVPTGTVVTGSNTAFVDGSNTVWRVNVAADDPGDSATVFIGSEDFSADPALRTGFDLTGSGVASELLFDLRVNADTGANLFARMDSGSGDSGRVALPLAGDNAWHTYSVRIADLEASPAPGGSGLDLANVVNLFALEVSGGTIEVDLDNIRVSVVCRDAGTCDPKPLFETATVEYSQNFEMMEPNEGPPPNSLSADGWVVFGIATFQGTFLYQYGVFDAPNGGAGFSAVVDDQGGPDQGSRQLSIYNDYDNQDHGLGADINALVFRERAITADDVGLTITFSFDAKRGNINDPNDPNCASGCTATARAFIKTLDPSSNFDQTNIDFVDMTTISDTWQRYSVSLENVDPLLVDQLLQYGFESTATQFQPSGIVYDNLELTLGPAAP